MARKGTVWQIDGLPCTPTQNMKREKWLELRRLGIGGSDVAGIMKRSPWSTPLKIWCEKVGLAPDRDPTESMEFGLMMEPTLRNWAVEKMNTHYTAGPAFKILSSPYLYARSDHPEYIANVDGVVLLDSDNTEQLWAGLELKTTDRYYAEDWAEDTVPDYYMPQVQWYMSVTGLMHWVIGVLIGKRFEIRVIDRDESLIASALEDVEPFWQRVIDRLMPEARGEDVKLLTTLFKGQTDDIIQAADLAGTLEEYLEIAEELKNMTGIQDGLKATIEQRIGNNKGLEADGFTANWSRWEQSRVNTKMLKEMYPEVHAAVVKPRLTGRLTVKRPKEIEDATL